MEAQVGLDGAAVRRFLDLSAELVGLVAGGPAGTGPDAVRGEIERGLDALAAALGAEGAYFFRHGRHPDDVVLVARSPAGSEVRSVLLVPLPHHRRFDAFVGLLGGQASTAFPDQVGALLRLAGECFMTLLAQVDAGAALLDARRELEHHNDELERSNEELERFAYAAAHDLKAPLSRVEMALSAMSEGSPEGGDGEPVGIARRGAARMRQLIEDLLAYAGVQSRVGTPQPVDLDAVLDDVLGDLSPTLEAGGVQVERAPLPGVVGHPSLLSQLLANLMANAAKFRREGVAHRVRVDAVSDAGGVTIRIADNGIGIPPERRGEVFGIFARVHDDDRFTGSGIGLATCAKVVASHGGRIWVEDGIDGGAAVHVWLPAA